MERQRTRSTSPIDRMATAQETPGKISATLHDVRLALHTDRADFLTSARDYLAPLLDTDEGAPDIDVQLTWHGGRSNGDGQNPARQGAPAGTLHDGMEQLGRRLWAGAGCLHFAEIWQLPGLTLNVTWPDGRLSVDAVYRWPSRRARWLTALVPAARQRLSVALVYYLTYFPWMWWLERERGWILLHAAAIGVPGGSGPFAPHEGMLLSGLPGCGKSTTALAFLNRAEWQIVSDNLLFTDGRAVFACVEPIHVDEQTRELAGSGEALSGRVRPTGRGFSYERQDYEVTPAARAPSAIPRAVGFLHVGRETAVDRLDPGEAARRLLANDYLAKEWLAYQESAAAMHQVWPGVGDQNRRNAHLVALTRSAQCYDVAVARGEDVNRAIAGILQTVKGDL
jgi:hypothetical protein